MEGFANSGKRNKADLQPAERDPLEEEAWQRDIANVANALSPLMVFTFMWAGAYEQSPFMISLHTSGLSMQRHAEVFAARRPSRGACGAVLATWPQRMPSEGAGVGRWCRWAPSVAPPPKAAPTRAPIVCAKARVHYTPRHACTGSVC